MTQTATDQSEPNLLTLEFVLQAEDFQIEWGRCNLLANYIAEYTAYQFTHRERAENLISTITNELLETAASLTTAETDVLISVKHQASGLEINACYKIRPELITPYREFIGNLDQANSNLYFSLLTQEARSTEHFNQLGLIMLTHDFGVQITVHPQSGSDHICTKLLVAHKEFSA